MGQLCCTAPWTPFSSCPWSCAVHGQLEAVAWPSASYNALQGFWFFVFKKYLARLATTESDHPTCLIHTPSFRVSPCDYLSTFPLSETWSHLSTGVMGATGSTECSELSALALWPMADPGHCVLFQGRCRKSYIRGMPGGAEIFSSVNGKWLILVYLK